MALFTDSPASGYSQPHMPQPARGDGPWGEAIEYWLNVRRWRQADLMRATAGKGDLTKNTISRAANGQDVNTETLRIIATAFGVALEDVLVSPDRQSAKEREEQMVERITKRVVGEIVAERRPRPLDVVTAETPPHEALAPFERAAARIVARAKTRKRRSGKKR